MDFNFIRKKVVVFLAERNLNQTWLANQLGSDQPLISQWLSGKRVPRKSNIAKIIALLKSHGVKLSPENENNFEVAESSNFNYNASSQCVVPPDLIQIPILSSLKNFNAQSPNPAYVAGSIYYPRYEMVTEYPGVSFALKAKDSSMEPEISRGATCFVSPETELTNGKTMVLYNKKTDDYFIGKVSSQNDKHAIMFNDMKANSVIFDKAQFDVIGEVKAYVNKIGG
ncbi:MAG: hypothetical protein FWC85_01485 [Elusimicrobia bacterium]|nr:hypothetical protein [Elusimicrobiota bacterium]